MIKHAFGFGPLAHPRKNIPVVLVAASRAYYLLLLVVSSGDGACAHVYDGAASHGPSMDVTPDPTRGAPWFALMTVEVAGSLCS